MSESIRTIENRVICQRNWKIFYYVIWENGLVSILLPTNMAAAIQMYEDFLNLNSRNSYIYWYIDLKLAETFQDRAIYIG